MSAPKMTQYRYTKSANSIKSGISELELLIAKGNKRPWVLQKKRAFEIQLERIKLMKKENISFSEALEKIK